MPVHAATTAATSNALENIVEPEDEVLPVAAAEGGLDAHEDAVRAAETKTKAVIRFQVAEVQILQARRDLAGVDKQGPVNGGEDLPAIFGLEQQRVVVAKTAAVKPAQIVRAAERPQVIEGHTGAL